MKLKVQLHSTDRLSLVDRASVFAAASRPWTTLSEWAANLAEAFETPGATELHHGWFVIQDELGVYLRHPYVLVVLSVKPIPPDATPV